MDQQEQLGRRIAILSIAVSGALAVSKILVGYLAHSSAVISDGIESASDVFGSAIVLIGLSIASRPADEDHPYGHGRFETLSGLAVGLLLVGSGVGICVRAVSTATRVTPALFAIWPLIVSTVLKAGLSILKFRVAKTTGSESLKADGWNDTVDILSGLMALAAVSLAISAPDRFGSADQIGAFAIGLVVVFLGVRVVYQTTSQLSDVMPEKFRIDAIRESAMRVPGALGVEKCYARKTGLKYHVDLHLEVDPSMTVSASHLVGHNVRDRVLHDLDWVADVLVHVEPYGTATIEAGPEWRIAK